jgi:plastocyanin
MRKTIILLGAVAVFLVGCGDSGSSSTPVKLSGSVNNKGTKDLSGSSMEIELDDFYFNPTFIKGGTPGSTVTLELKNEGKQPHTFTSKALGVDERLEAGSTKTVTVTLPASGATEFHCTFHLQSNGMQGAFFFKDGDVVAATGGGGASTTSSSADGNPYN